MMSERYQPLVVVSRSLSGTEFRLDLHRSNQLVELNTAADLVEWTGYDIDSLTEVEAAAALAARAWQKICPGSSVIDGDRAGVGCRIVDTTSTRFGALVVHTDARTDLLLWELPIGRESQFAAATTQLLEAVLEGLERGCPPDTATQRAIIPGLSHRWAVAPAEIRALMSGRVGVVWRRASGELTLIRPGDVGAVLSGAFNPLHEGHAALRRAAAEFLEVETAYELPIVNADKPPIDFLSLEQRIAQFDGAPLALSRAATFAEKVRLLPRMTFVVGFDTALRILEPRYYGGIDAMLEALRQFGEAGGSFLVAGRFCEGRFRSLADLPCPAAMRDLFEELPASRFRVDVSSTDLRRQR